MFLNLTLACVCLLITPNGASPQTGEYQLDTSEIEAVRNTARLWVEYERLPRAKAPLSAAAEARFAEAWARFGVACRHVEETWAQAFEEDPLFERAAECLNRLVELEWQFNLLRNDIRNQHGNDKFGEFETQGRAWIETSGMPWLDLDDEDLVRLYLRVMSLVHNRDKVQDGGIPTSDYEWMRTTEPFASEVSDADEELTEARAIEICRAAISRQRTLMTGEHVQIGASLNLPPNMWRYLEVRAEADYLALLGEWYLGIGLRKNEDIRKAEAEFQLAGEQVTAIRPDAMESLHVAHKERIERLVQEQARQHEAFQASLRGDAEERK